MTARSVIAAVALALATVLALLAHAVLSVGNTGSTGETRPLLAPLATHLAGSRGTDQAQRAVKYLLDKRGGRGSVLRRHAESKAILTKLISTGPRSERSWAANMLGAVAAQDSMLDGANAASYVQEALGAFRRAIFFEGASEDPKFNLELLLTLDRIGKSAQQHASPKRKKHITKRSNARHAESGYGY